MIRAVGYGATTQGRGRSVNEDYLLWDDEHGIYIVCDGIGGHPGGDVAAELAARTAQEFLVGEEPLLLELHNHSKPISKAAVLAERAVHEACNAVFQRSISDKELSHMGCSMTLALVVGSKGVMAHVGDNRLYLSRSNSLNQLSNDHTYSAELMRQGAIQPEKVAKHPYSHILTRYVGQNESVLVDTLVFDLMAGDKILICSNGLFESIDPATLADEMLRKAEDLPARLVDLAQESNVDDDVTALVVAVLDDAKSEDSAAKFKPKADRYLEALKSCGIFKDLNLCQLMRIRNHGEEVYFKRGTEIQHEGLPCGGLQLVVSGTVNVIQDGQIRSRISVGDFASADALLLERPARSTLVAHENVLLLFLSRKNFQILNERFPRIGTAVLARIGRMLALSLDRAHLLLKNEQPSVPHGELASDDII